MRQTTRTQAKQQRSLVTEIRRQASSGPVRQLAKRLSAYEPVHDTPEYLKALLAKLEQQTISS